jgi:hypothetical protein
MARRKRTSVVLKRAVRRAASINSIAPKLDLGNGLTLPAFSSLIEMMRSKENAYNSALSSLDKLYREMLETESELGDMTERAYANGSWDSIWQKQCRVRHGRRSS